MVQEIEARQATQGLVENRPRIISNVVLQPASDKNYNNLPKLSTQNQINPSNSAENVPKAWTQSSLNLDETAAVPRKRTVDELLMDINADFTDPIIFDDEFSK